MKVLIGNNQFVDCDTLVGVQGQPLLRVEVSPLRVTLETPSELPSARALSVKNGVVKAVGGQARVVSTERSFGVFWDDTAVLLATLIDDSTVHLRIDLRLLGINLYDDIDGLHVGGNIFSQNELSRARTAIALA